MELEKEIKLAERSIKAGFFGLIGLMVGISLGWYVRGQYLPARADRWQLVEVANEGDEWNIIVRCEGEQEHLELFQDGGVKWGPL